MLTGTRHPLAGTPCTHQAVPGAHFLVKSGVVPGYRLSPGGKQVLATCPGFLKNSCCSPNFCAAEKHLCAWFALTSQCPFDRSMDTGCTTAWAQTANAAKHTRKNYHPTSYCQQPAYQNSWSLINPTTNSVHQSLTNAMPCTRKRTTSTQDKTNPGITYDLLF
jgi:hypothetical protein